MSIAVAYMYLLGAILCEVTATISLRLCESFTKFWPSIFTVISMVISMALLSFSVKHIPIGTAYAVWAGIGAAGTAILGIFLFKESSEIVRLFFMFLIVTGIVALKLFS